MGCESSASPSGKRSRDAEDEVYLDNFHSHKRYLSEVMASSLNGLSFGESLPEHLMESPARSEGMCNTRDEIPLQYSPMSEDLDDTRYIESPLLNTTAQADSMPISPASSPHRHQRPPSVSSSTTSTTLYPSLSCSLNSVNCSPSRQRASDSEGRLPSSPSDICHPADLRRAALLRSVQMRTQPLVSPSVELPSCLGREPMHNIEAEEQSCSYLGSLVDEKDYQNQQQGPSLFTEECTMVMSESGVSQKNSCRALDMNAKGEESGEEGVYGRNGVLERSGLIPSSRRSLLDENSKSRIDFK